MTRWVLFTLVVLLFIWIGTAWTLWIMVNRRDREIERLRGTLYRLHLKSISNQPGYYCREQHGSGRGQSAKMHWHPPVRTSSPRPGDTLE